MVATARCLAVGVGLAERHFVTQAKHYPRGEDPNEVSRNVIGYGRAADDGSSAMIGILRRVRC